MSGVGVSVRAVFSSSVSRRGVGVGCSVLSFGAWRGVMSLSSFHAFSFSLPCVPHCLVSALFVYRRPVRRLVSSCRGASRVLRRLVVAFRSSWGVFVFHIRMRRFSQLNSPVGFSFVITEGGRMVFSYETQGMSMGAVWDAKEETAGAGLKAIA